MSYEFYKITHIVCLLIFVSGMSASFFSANPPKLLKILTGVTSLLIFVAGMGLILRGLNLSHGESWPTWIYLKLVLWLLASVLGPVLSKRLTSNRGLAFSGVMLLVFGAVVLAILKPFY